MSYIIKPVCPSGELNGYRCVCADAVRKNPLTSRSTNAEVETEIKMWLRRAPDRQGGRTQRAEKAQKRRRQLAEMARGSVD